MNWLDIAILIIIGLFTLLGFMRGLIREVISVVALIGGIIAGVMFYDLAGDIFISYGLLKNKPMASIAGFIATSLVVYILFQILGWMLTRIIGTLSLSWLNRACGGMVGAIKGIVIAFSLVSAVGFFFSPKEPPFRDSTMVPYIEESFTALKETVPEDFSDGIIRVKKLIQEKGLTTAFKEAERIRETFKDETTEKKETKKK
ncbi:MAG TPA: CvpA family protein [Thermodesulfobacteriota bacterium]|nr:CvpA family protein [Thermodesulfobacteriota bacterium]